MGKGQEERGREGKGRGLMKGKGGGPALGIYQALTSFRDLTSQETPTELCWQRQEAESRG